MQMKVIKNDGRTEDFIQTKILRTLSNCLSNFCDDNISTAQELTDAFTYHIFALEHNNVLTTAEIHIMLKAVLIETGFGNAAVALHEHHYGRILKRNHIEVVSMNINSLEDAKMFCEIRGFGQSQQWDKSAIVDWLMQKYEIQYLDARAIASGVEDKIMDMNQSCISTDIIKKLTLINAAEFINGKNMIEQKPANEHVQTDSSVGYSIKRTVAQEMALV